MRLLHTAALTLHTFTGPGRGAPRYVTLSHTWDDGEVLFEDMLSPERRALASKKKGFEKVQRACLEARSKGFNFIWIDTLCIDKSSSSELSEAINSMFEWYACSNLCIAYLADAVAGDEASFRSSRWFTRGWTLQELIAPSDVVFYDKVWKPMGTRRSLVSAIWRRTSISARILSRPIHAFSNVQSIRVILAGRSVATRMSWVADRETTRPEDIAYCMLGIFNVNMPLLYGEGGKAFVRLQEEIMKHSIDQSILAWSFPAAAEEEVRGRRWDMILSSSPMGFVGGEGIQPVPGRSRRDGGSLCYEGLDLEVQLCPVEAASKEWLQGTSIDVSLLNQTIDQIQRRENGDILLFLAILDCCIQSNYVVRPAILLYQIRGKQNAYFRASSRVCTIRPSSRWILSDSQSGNPGLAVDISRAIPTRIILCSPEASSWQTKMGYWPFSLAFWDYRTPEQAYAETACLCRRYTADGVLTPAYPTWNKSRDCLRQSEFLDPDCYVILSSSLFERAGHGAFFVICGFCTGPQTPRRSRPDEKWWRSHGEYFCSVLTWERVMAAPYDAALATSLAADALQHAHFRALLLRCLDDALPHLALDSWCEIELGEGEVVRASVDTRTFLGTEGLCLEVTVDERRRGDPNGQPVRREMPEDADWYV